MKLYFRESKPGDTTMSATTNADGSPSDWSCVATLKKDARWYATLTGPDGVVWTARMPLPTLVRARAQEALDRELAVQVNQREESARRARVAAEEASKRRVEQERQASAQRLRDGVKFRKSAT